MTKLLFIPISILGGILAGTIGRKTFEFAWAKIDDEGTPDPQQQEVDWRKLAIALALEGAISRVVRGFLDHAFRKGFSRATGTWPGETEEQG